jgi:hypothetical protein
MAIIRTAMGVDGCREVISAAFAFASVTASAWVAGTFDVEAKGQAPAVELLAPLADGVIAGALHVAEQPLQVEIPAETCAARHLQGDLDGADGRPPGHGSPHQHLIRRLRPHAAGRRGVHHLAHRHARRGQLRLHRSHLFLDAGVVPTRGDLAKGE